MEEVDQRSFPLGALGGCIPCWGEDRDTNLVAVIAGDPVLLMSERSVPQSCTESKDLPPLVPHGKDDLRS